MTAVGDSPRWEPGSLSTLDLDRVLTDALADLFRDAYRRDSTVVLQACRFRESLERAVEHATGIPLAGLPARTAPVPLSAVPASRDLARRAQGRFGDGAR